MWQVLVLLLPLVAAAPSLSSLGFFSSVVKSEIPNIMRYNNVLRAALPVAGLVASCNATNLYVSSYSGNVTTYSLTKSGAGYSITQLGVTNGSAPQASWLELNAGKKAVYGLDEAWSTPNGTLTVYSTNGSALKVKSKHVTLPGAVSTILYNGGKGLAVAHYGGQALTSWGVGDDGDVTNIGDFHFTQADPGADPDRQDLPHPHETLVDPTDSYIISPDLGSDLLRVFSIDAKTSKLTERTAFATPPGSGPRHGAFFTPPCSPGALPCAAATSNNTYFFLVSELGNTVTSYKVTYGKDSLGFTLVETHGIYGTKATPVGAAAAEGILSPDNKFFHTSSRNATFLSSPNPDSANTTSIPSDTLQTWSIAPATGKLTFVASYPAGGVTPRQFSINAKGDLAAVGLQTTGRFVILDRDVKTGAFGKVVASVENLGEVTAVIWDEGGCERIGPFSGCNGKIV